MIFICNPGGPWGGRGRGRVIIKARKPRAKGNWACYDKIKDFSWQHPNIRVVSLQ